MIIVEKAYRGYFKWYLEENPTYEGILIYAENCNKARYKVYQKTECESFKDMFEIVVKRDKTYDKIENTPLPIIAELNATQIKLMQHAIGEDYYNPDGPYRNYLCLEHEPELESLIEKELVVKQTHINQNYYHLTELGITVIKSTQPYLRGAN